MFPAVSGPGKLTAHPAKCTALGNRKLPDARASRDPLRLGLLPGIYHSQNTESLRLVY